MADAVKWYDTKRRVQTLPFKHSEGEHDLSPKTAALYHKCCDTWLPEKVRPEAHMDYNPGTVTGPYWRYVQTVGPRNSEGKAELKYKWVTWREH